MVHFGELPPLHFFEVIQILLKNINNKTSCIGRIGCHQNIDKFFMWICFVVLKREEII